MVVEHYEEPAGVFWTFDSDRKVIRCVYNGKKVLAHHRMPDTEANRRLIEGDARAALQAAMMWPGPPRGFDIELTVDWH